MSLTCAERADQGDGTRGPVLEFPHYPAVYPESHNNCQVCQCQHSEPPCGAEPAQLIGPTTCSAYTCHHLRENGISQCSIKTKMITDKGGSHIHNGFRAEDVKVRNLSLYNDLFEMNDRSAMEAPHSQYDVLMTNRSHIEHGFPIKGVISNNGSHTSNGSFAMERLSNRRSHIQSSMSGLNMVCSPDYDLFVPNCWGPMEDNLSKCNKLAESISHTNSGFPEKETYTSSHNGTSLMGTICNSRSHSQSGFSVRDTVNKKPLCSSGGMLSVRVSTLCAAVELYLLLALLSQVVLVSDASADIRIECLADRYRAVTRNQWRGYTLHNLGLPSLGVLDFTLAFPKDVPLGSCCQKLQLRFTAHTVRNIVEPSVDMDGGYFIPNVEWTLCTTDTRLFNCYGYHDVSAGTGSEDMRDDMVGADTRNDDSGDDTVDEVTVGHIPATKPLTGSWWFVIQHCLRPASNSASYEVGTFGLSGLSAVSAPRYSGNTKITTLSTIHVPRTQVSSNLPCLIEGHVDTTEQWFGYLATMTVPRDSSISYHFLFKEAEPSNAALLNVLFYSETDIVDFTDNDSCEEKVAVLGSQPNTHKILPLSIGNTWSGCGVESVNGTPTYTCEGGRNVDETHTVYIAIANCKRTQGLHLYYYLEFQNYESDCPTTETNSMVQGRAVVVNCHVLVLLLVLLSNWC